VRAETSWPLVPTLGGQAEIVKRGLSGYLCRNMEELVDYSGRLADNEELLGGVSRHAIERGQILHGTLFEKHIAQVVSRCI